MIKSDAKNHRNYLQNGKFSRCARHPTRIGIPGGQDGGTLVLLLMFSRAREGASINYKIVFVLMRRIDFAVDVFSRAGEGASTNYKIVFVLLRRTGFVINVFANGRRRFYHSQNNI